jgi:hypothetical protein
MIISNPRAIMESGIKSVIQAAVFLNLDLSELETNKRGPPYYGFCFFLSPNKARTV